MQAMRADTYVHVSLSKTYKGKPRRVPAWEMRYRLRSGKDSARVLGPAWMSKGRPPHGRLTEQEALSKANVFAAEHAADTPDLRRCFDGALKVFLRNCALEKKLRGSTLHEYRRSGERLAARPWRKELTWADRQLDDFDEIDLLDLRGELTDAERSAHTLNHYRRVLRGVFGTAPSSPALAWEWIQPKVESEGKLRFYTPSQVRKLCEHAYSDLDRAIFTLMTQEGPRLSEVRGLKVETVDFAMDLVRFEDGYTTHGGHAGNKGRRVRSVAMSRQVRAVLLPPCEGKDPKALVFEEPDRPGEPICGVNLYRRFIKAAERAGLPRICLHDLRHTFGTQAIRKFALHEVQRMMGHRHISTTEIYVHYAPDPNAAEKLSSLWEEDDPPTPPVGREQAAAMGELAPVIPLRRAA
jgi:integrase